VDDVSSFLRRHAHTPFAQVIRRQGFVRCYLYGRPAKGLPPPRWIPSAKSSGTTTQAPPPQRPARSGPSSGGSGGGATSGGK
jgi:hypothetical protein